MRSKPAARRISPAASSGSSTPPPPARSTASSASPSRTAPPFSSRRVGHPPPALQTSKDGPPAPGFCESGERRGPLMEHLKKPAVTVLIKEYYNTVIFCLHRGILRCLFLWPVLFRIVYVSKLRKRKVLGVRQPHALGIVPIHVLGIEPRQTSWKSTPRNSGSNSTLTSLTEAFHKYQKVRLLCLFAITPERGSLFFVSRQVPVKIGRLDHSRPVIEAGDGFTINRHCQIPQLLRQLTIARWASSVRRADQKRCTQE